MTRRILWLPGCSCRSWTGPAHTSPRLARQAWGEHHDDCPQWQRSFGLYRLACDCGWTYGPGLKTDCEQQARHHRASHQEAA
jgi:hypothetical protein